MADDFQRVEIPIEYPTEGIPSGYATRMIVQHNEHEFTLTFYEVKTPIILGTDEEQAEQLRQLESIRAKPIAQVTIAAGRMPNFIEALITNYEKFEERFLEKRAEEVNGDDS